MKLLHLSLLVLALSFAISALFTTARAETINVTDDVSITVSEQQEGAQKATQNADGSIDLK